MNSNHSSVQQSIHSNGFAVAEHSPTVLTAEELDFYREQGYVHAHGAVAPEALQLARTVLERWVEEIIQSWQVSGLLADTRPDLDFEHRLVQVWNAAGKPGYIRSPRRDLVSREMFEFLSHPSLVDLAEELLGTPEISVHGVFNARPKLPDQKWTDTPWHQDAQYYTDAAEIPVVTLWIPLQRVTEQNSCLQVAGGHQGEPLHEAFKDETGFIGLSKERGAALKGVSIEMEPGDALCFTQKTPHRATSNQSDAVRWSMDVRFEATTNATQSGKEMGFIARSEADPDSVTTCEEWLKKWESVPAGSY